MRTIWTVALGLVALGLAGVAEAKPFKYRSRHPARGGFCPVAAPHTHDHAPRDRRVFQVVGDEYHFVGDPVAFGYEGPRHAYYGEHPIVEADAQLPGAVYCYLEGPHYHAFAPPPAAGFELRAGVSWFVGGFAPAFFELRPRFRIINEVHRPLVYARPVVTVADAPSS